MASWAELGSVDSSCRISLSYACWLEPASFWHDTLRYFGGLVSTREHWNEKDDFKKGRNESMQLLQKHDCMLYVNKYIIINKIELYIYIYVKNTRYIKVKILNKVKVMTRMTG